ncbi:MAG: uL13 family ribosomal protein [Parcubacteria group bacterium]|nr:uL13 family ribosomal protein [Parcubacteria group bacterium]MCR4342979.1 uL13 family ribosomal protein [Patescibacteria group bacterium]
MEKEYTIDAKGRSLGRVASEAAKILNGKTSPDYEANKVAPVKLTVLNASALNVPLKKLKQKKYVNYSGYPGSQSFETLEKLIERLGMGEALKIAVKNMLPKNKLNKLMMKNLNIKD